MAKGSGQRAGAPSDLRFERGSAMKSRLLCVTEYVLELLWQEGCAPTCVEIARYASLANNPTKASWVAGRKLALPVIH